MVSSKDPVAKSLFKHNPWTRIAPLFKLGTSITFAGIMPNDYDVYFPHVRRVIYTVAPREPLEDVLRFIHHHLKIPMSEPEAMVRIYYWLVHGRPAPATIEYIPLRTDPLGNGKLRWPSRDYKEWRWITQPDKDLMLKPPSDSIQFAPIFTHSVRSQPPVPILGPVSNAIRNPIRAASTTSLDSPDCNSYSTPGPLQGPTTGGALNRPIHNPVSDILQPQLHTPSGREMKEVANPSSQSAMAPGAIPPALPPSVEEAYKRKCIDLKRRMNEVETSNDAYRLRKVRLMRGIRKMRLERAFLLETLGKRMRKNGTSVNGLNGMYDEDSEGSSESPPTPQEKPLRSKRGHRRPLPSPPPLLQQMSQPSNHSQPHHSSTYSTPIAPQPSAFFSAIAPTNGTPITPLQQQPQPYLPSAIGSTQLIAPAHPPPNHTANNHLITRPSRPLAPREDFAEALIREEILPRRSEFEPMSDSAFRAYAFTVWAQLPYEESEKWVRKYEADLSRYHHDMAEWRKAQRAAGKPVGASEAADEDVEMEMEMETEAVVQEQEQEHEQEQGPEREERETASAGAGGSGNAGGFTAVNG